MNSYDALYSEHPHALGAPTPAVVAVLDLLPPPPLSILDVGCGQGRDALPLARKGYAVTGIDPSRPGVVQMCAEAEAEGLDIKGHVTTGAVFVTADRFDVLLCDRTLHMILNAAERHATLTHLLGLTRPEGYVLIADEPSNMDGLRDVLRRHGPDAVPMTDGKDLLLWRIAA